MRTFHVILAALTLLISATLALARGGGGCFEAGTPVLTPCGPRAIEQLKPGDAVFSVVANQLCAARVSSCQQVTPAQYIEIQLDDRRLHVTAEHPFETSRGTFVEAHDLHAGDEIECVERDVAHARRIASVRIVAAVHPAYNLLVTPGGTFVADGAVVHNKGCFLPDTPILRADGSEAPIASIKPGDELLAFSEDGTPTHAIVRDIITHDVDEYLLLATDQITLKVTAEHPFFVGHGTFKTVDALSVGDTIYAYDGSRSLSPQRITSIQRVSQPVRVYNLQTDEPHTFFAHGIAVHNKGGCFPAGTPVLTPDGTRAIEQLHIGDAIIAITAEGQATNATVESTFTTRSPLLIITTDRGELRTTSEHPLALPGGGFIDAGEVKAGDRLLVWSGRAAEPAAVIATRTESDLAPVFNLAVSGPHTYVAANFVVHNKGGCFPAGTMVDTPRGRVRIEQLRVGDAVITGSVSSAAKSGSSEYLRTRRGGIVERSETTFGQSSVRATFSTRSSLLVLVTEAGELRVTPEHPLALVSREFRAAEEIAIGESLLVRQGDQLRATQLLSRRQEAQPVTVYNLEVDDPHTFIADGFVVHNKGGFSGGHSSSHSYGGSSRYYGSSRSSTRPTSGPARVMWWFWDECGFFGCLVGGIFAINAVLSLFKRKSHGDEDLDFVYSPAAVAAKAMKTRQLLATLAATDPSMDPGKLVQLARDTFVKLQQCWESREYGPMQPLMMPDLYRQHVEQLDGMKRNHEINRIDNLQVDAIDVVNVRYTYKENTREFTALISARARDFYVDDRNNHFLRGDAQPARFQEFWTFHRQDGQWLLREVEQSRESDVLKDENFVEQFTDTHLKQVYATAASPGGPAGPWLEKQVETKATKTERLLNFLVQTDKLWNRDAMLTRARDVFVAVMLAQESNDPTSVPADDMFPHAADDLRRVIAQRRMNGGRIEYRNLCVRKVELILVRNFADNSKDEFVTRISAHAQTIITQNGRTTRADEYVTPFMQYWTFGRLDEQWKLKEVLAEMAGKAATTAENVDEDSSAEQMQWYYSKTRAN